MARENYSKCPSCKGKIIFHIGDKVYFGGNKTHYSHGELRDLADDKISPRFILLLPAHGMPP